MRVLDKLFIGIIGIIVLLSVIGVVGRLLNESAQSGLEEPVACTMEAKQCPDGSFVGREGPACEFAACPGEAEVVPDS